MKNIVKCCSWLEVYHDLCNISQPQWSFVADLAQSTNWITTKIDISPRVKWAHPSRAEHQRGRCECDRRAKTFWRRCRQSCNTVSKIKLKSTGHFKMKSLTLILNFEVFYSCFASLRSKPKPKPKQKQQQQQQKLARKDKAFFCTAVRRMLISQVLPNSSKIHVFAHAVVPVPLPWKKKYVWTPTDTVILT